MATLSRLLGPRETGRLDQALFPAPADPPRRLETLRVAYAARALSIARSASRSSARTRFVAIGVGDLIFCARASSVVSRKRDR